ncbi:MAG: hypothetical protein A2284_03710, partial [Deltaproteobacteria bacterium RIFOXYA12_FULL_61_11]
MDIVAHWVFGKPVEGQFELNQARALLAEARNRRKSLQEIPFVEIVECLHRVRGHLSQVERRRASVERIAAGSNFSTPMVDLAYGVLLDALDRSMLEAKVKEELGSLEVLDVPVHDRSRSQLLKASPLGVVLHLASGNVFLTAVLTLVEGLLTKNVNIIKMSSRERWFALEFARAVTACDPEGIVASSFAVLDLPGRDDTVLGEFYGGVDGVVVWGGEEVVKQLRGRLPVTCRAIEYGPKFSVAVVTSAAVKSYGAELLAEALAHSVAVWDQQACSSPQVLYTDLCEAELEAFLDHVCQTLDRLASTLPLGRRTLDELAEVTKERELAAFNAAIGTGGLRTSGSRQEWTIIVEEKPGFRLSPLNRTLLVSPLKTPEYLFEQLSAVCGHLQTIGLAASREERSRFLEIAELLGATRITSLEGMSGGVPGEPHDGVHALRRLVRWVSTEVGSDEAYYSPLETLSLPRLERLVLGRLRARVARAREGSDYYRERLDGIELRSLDDLASIPLLSPRDLPDLVPPRSRALFCSEPRDGYVFRSGGSSGRPKYSLYSLEDVAADMAAAARGPYALGLRPGRRVASMFSAGSLYGSFISSIKIAELLGCQVFPLTSHADTEMVLATLEAFSIDTVLGIPSTFLCLVREHGERFRSAGVKCFLYAGEHVFEEDRALLASYGIDDVLSFGYGTVDAGPLGYQCLHCRGSEHHLLVGHQHLELLGLDDDLPCPVGRAGRVVVTNLERALMPLLRYD